METEQSLTQLNGQAPWKEVRSSTIQKLMQVRVNLASMHQQHPSPGEWMIGSIVRGQHQELLIQYGLNIPILSRL